MAKPKKVAFIDTNIFLHYTFFSDVDWPTVLDAGEVTIVMPPIVMRELEKRKYNEKEDTLKRRAEGATAKLAQLFRSGDQVRPGTSIYFEAHEPDVEFTPHRLSRETQDDHLLASICLYRRENSDAEIILVTNDLPLEVKAAALSIETRVLAEDYRLPIATDPNLKRVRELEQQLRELTNRQPLPELLFDNGINRIEFNADALPPPSKSVADRLDEIKQNHPQLDVPPLAPRPSRPEPSKPNEVVITADPWPDDRPHPRDIEKYNQELASFYQKSEEYLIQLDRAVDLNSRKLALQIQLGNAGTTPIESAVVFLKVPGELRLTQDETEFRYPESPKPPELPQPRHHRDFGDVFNRPLSPDIFARYRPPQYIDPPNIERNAFNHSQDSYEISFRVRQALHNLVYDCPYDLFLVFDSREEARSFGIEYRIVAANLPRPIDGQLHVVVKRSV